jgi:hypothetical protein
MPDTRPVTDQEYEIFASFCLEKGIALDGEVGQKNGALFSNLLADRNQRITKENLESAFATIKNQLAMSNPVKAEYDRLVINFSDYDRDFIAAGLARYGYDVSDSLLHNWNIVAKAFLARGYQVTNDNFRIVIGNLGPGANLRRKATPKKFDAEAAVKAQKESPKVQRDEEQATQRAGDHPDSWTRPLSGALKAHRDMLHSKTEKIEPERSDPEQFYREKAEGLVNAIQSNVDREEARQILKNGPGWGWQLTFKTIEHYIARRNYERGTAGR